MHSRARYSWSDLPQELLEIIAKLLEHWNDVCRFRAVCKHWRQSAPFSVLLNPLLPYNLRFLYTKLSSSSLVLVASSVCLLQPKEPTKLLFPWIVTVEEFNSGKVFLRQPLCRTSCQQLPEQIPKVMDLSLFNVSELFKSYYLRDRDNPDDIFVNKRWIDYHINKVVLFVDRACSPDNCIDDCTAIVLYNNGNLLALRLGESEACVPLKAPKRGCHAKFDDVVNFKSKVYAVDRTGKTYSITYGNLKVENVVSVPIAKGKNSDRKKWLVESSGELYLIHRYYGNKESKIQVYKLDEERCCWNKVESIGDDRVLFVTFDGCFFASVKAGWPWKGNCIIFYGGSFPSYNGHATNPDFNIVGRTETKIAVYYLKECSGWRGLLAIDHSHSLSKVFRPPPTWFLSDANSSVRPYPAEASGTPLQWSPYS